MLKELLCLTLFSFPAVCNWLYTFSWNAKKSLTFWIFIFQLLGTWVRFPVASSDVRWRSVHYINLPLSTNKFRLYCQEMTFWFLFTWYNKGSVQNSSLFLYLGRVPATWIGLHGWGGSQKFLKHGVGMAEGSALYFSLRNWKRLNIYCGQKREVKGESGFVVTCITTVSEAPWVSTGFKLCLINRDSEVYVPAEGCMHCQWVTGIEVLNAFPFSQGVCLSCEMWDCSKWKNSRLRPDTERTAGNRKNTALLTHYFFTWCC